MDNAIKLHESPGTKRKGGDVVSQQPSSKRQTHVDSQELVRSNATVELSRGGAPPKSLLRRSKRLQSLGTSDESGHSKEYISAPDEQFGQIDRSRGVKDMTTSLVQPQKIVASIRPSKKTTTKLPLEQCSVKIVGYRGIQDDMVVNEGDPTVHRSKDIRVSVLCRVTQGSVKTDSGPGVTNSEGRTISTFESISGTASQPEQGNTSNGLQYNEETKVVATFPSVSSPTPTRVTPDMIRAHENTNETSNMYSPVVSKPGNEKDHIKEKSNDPPTHNNAQLHPWPAYHCGSVYRDYAPAKTSSSSRQGDVNWEHYKGYIYNYYSAGGWHNGTLPGQDFPWPSVGPYPGYAPIHFEGHWSADAISPPASSKTESRSKSKEVNGVDPHALTPESVGISEQEIADFLRGIFDTHGVPENGCGDDEQPQTKASSNSLFPPLNNTLSPSSPPGVTGGYGSVKGTPKTKSPVVHSSTPSPSIAECEGERAIEEDTGSIKEKRVTSKDADES